MRESGNTRVRIGNVWIDALTLPGAIATISDLVEHGRGGTIFTPNVDHVVKAEKDAAFRAAYDAASLSLADGQPLVWASRLLGTPLPERVAGSDVIEPLLGIAGRRKWSVFFLGGGAGVAEKAATRAWGQFGVDVAGTDAPWVSLGGIAEGEDAVLERIRSSGTRLLLVALGAPKQELWIHRCAARLRPAVAIGVGAALDFVAGAVPRAPRWMSRGGGGCLYRPAPEPRRLARRYLVDDLLIVPVFARTMLQSREQR